jgi:hypothetical protein
MDLSHSSIYLTLFLNFMTSMLHYFSFTIILPCWLLTMLIILAYVLGRRSGHYRRY